MRIVPVSSGSSKSGALSPVSMDGDGYRRDASAQVPRIDEALHEGDVEPAPELAPDLALDAHQLEPAGAVQGDGGLVAADDAGHDGVEAVGLGQPDQLAEEEPRPTPWPWASAST